MFEDMKDSEEQEIEEIEIEITQANVDSKELEKEPPIEFYEGTIEYATFDAKIDYST